MYNILGQFEYNKDIMERDNNISDIIDAVHRACNLATVYRNTASQLDGGAWWSVSVFDMDCIPPRLVVTMDAADYI